MYLLLCYLVGRVCIPREANICQELSDAHREGNGNPLQYSCLENPMDGGAW